MVVRMRATRSHRDNRRSHHALSNPTLAMCECGAKHLRHRACAACGTYRGRQVVDVVARTERTQKRLKKKEALLRETGMEQKKEEPAAEKPAAKKTTKKKAAAKSEK